MGQLRKKWGEDCMWICEKNSGEQNTKNSHEVQADLQKENRKTKKNTV